jgi:hypothetical protein
VSNVHKKKKQYREAEEVLLRGTAATLGASDPHEHPFWYAALSLPSSPCSAGVGLRPLCRTQGPEHHRSCLYAHDGRRVCVRVASGGTCDWEGTLDARQRRSLASLYWDQGDYNLFYRYAQLGLKHKSSASCHPLADPSCSVPPFEIDIMGLGFRV